MSYYARGLFPGPDEEREAFLKRVEGYPCQTALPFIEGMAPDWIEVKRSQQGLRLWEGACTWIEEGKSPLLQVGTKHFGFYSEEEILRHEIVHCIRSAFKEPLFEEILAYHTSPMKWRRFWGPFFRTPGETLLFLGVALFSAVGSWFFPWSLALLPLAVGYGVGRLFYFQKKFRQARKKLESLFGAKSYGLLLGLTDGEILQFAKISPEEMRSFIERQTSFRWEILKSG